jgi:hypothetical protein
MLAVAKPEAAADKHWPVISSTSRHPIPSYGIKITNTDLKSVVGWIPAQTEQNLATIGNHTPYWIKWVGLYGDFDRRLQRLAYYRLKTALATRWMSQP